VNIETEKKTKLSAWDWKLNWIELKLKNPHWPSPNYDQWPVQAWCIVMKLVSQCWLVCSSFLLGFFVFKIVLIIYIAAITVLLSVIVHNFPSHSYWSSTVFFVLFYFFLHFLLSNTFCLFHVVKYHTDSAQARVPSFPNSHCANKGSLFSGVFIKLNASGCVVLNTNLVSKHTKHYQFPLAAVNSLCS